MKYQSFEHFMVEIVCDIEEKRCLPIGVSKIVTFLIKQGWYFFDGIHYDPLSLLSVYATAAGQGFSFFEANSFIKNAWFPKAVNKIGNSYKSEYKNNENDDDYITRLHGLMISRLDYECSKCHCFSRC